MNLDEFSKQLIERAVAQLDEKSGCNHSGAGTSCPLHGDADCNSSKQNRAEEVEKEPKHEDEKEDKALIKKEVKKALKNEARDMPGNQEKIDANKNGKVDAGDFAILRARKGKKSVKEMWEKAAEVQEAWAKKKAVDEGKKVEIEIMPQVDTPNDPEPPTGKKAKLKKEEVEDIAEVKMDGKDDNGFKSCWKGYKKQGTKEKGGKEVNNCVKAGYEMEEGEELQEKRLSAKEKAKKEKFVKGMKKKFSSFKSKYGNKAKDVMYGTATAMAKKAA